MLPRTSTGELPVTARLLSSVGLLRVASKYVRIEINLAVSERETESERQVHVNRDFAFADKSGNPDLETFAAHRGGTR